LQELFLAGFLVFCIIRCWEIFWFGSCRWTSLRKIWTCENQAVRFREVRPIIISHISPFYTRKNHTSCIASLPTSRQQVVFALFVPSCQQVWNNWSTAVTTLLIRYYQTCCNVVQQVQYSHDITILLQPCVTTL
jgi:hypothetical protein